MTHVSKLEQLTSMHQFQIVLLQMLLVDVAMTQQRALKTP
jgi:hypothetical protein